jgi:rhodanese-related sulfurtransferase
MAASACARPTVAEDPAPTILLSACEAPLTKLEAQSSPSGVPEVSPEWVAEHSCPGLTVIDVRGEQEVATGMIAGAKHHALPKLEEALEAYDPHAPIVFVCRSGRRSARATQLAEEAGFTQVASMTGGMIRWREQTRATTTPSGTNAPLAAASEASVEPPLTDATFDAAFVQAQLNAQPIPSLRMATLLSRGTEACVDGRDEHAVLGAPGGDAGELVVTLATIEATLDRPLTSSEVRELFDANIRGFGRFYFHSDSHALEALEASLAADERFAGRTGDIEDFLRQPPPALRPALLDHLLSPATTGCGHLKLMLKHAAEYEVRPELVQMVLAEAYRHLWHEPERIDFVVLDGEHREEAILSFHAGHELFAFSSVPALPPQIGGHSVFVHHPEVSSYLQQLHTAFVFEELPALREKGLDPETFETELARRAQLHLGQTVGRLAPELPLFDVKLDAEGQFVVTPVEP